MGVQRPNVIGQFATGNGGQVLPPHNPSLACDFDSWGQARKGGIGPGLTEWRGHTGRGDPDQAGLHFDHKLAAEQPKNVKLRHERSEAAKPR